MRIPVRHRLARLVGAVGLIAALLMPAAAPAAAQEDKTLRVGTIQEFDSINPNLAYLVSSYEAFILNYDILVGFGPDLEYAPTGLATEWT